MSIIVEVEKNGSVITKFMVGEEPIVVGRSPDCDVVIEDSSISRHHCKVYMQSERIFVEDLGSSNGTIVDGELLVGESRILKTSFWRISDYIFKVRNVEGASLAGGRGEAFKAVSRDDLQFHRLVDHYYKEVLKEIKDPEGIDDAKVREVLKSKIEEEGVIGEYGFSYKEIEKAVIDEIFHYGVITPLLEDETVTEIMVNGPEKIYFERGGKIYRYKGRFYNDEAVRRVIEKIVFATGRRIDEGMPYVDARLLDGSRFNAVIPPIALDGSVITIRKFFKRKLTIDDLIKFGSITREMAEYLEKAVKYRKNIIVSGGTGTGKTTLLNVVASFIPPDERIITIEDSAELQLHQEHVVRLEARPPNIEGKGAITIRNLVRNALRMRPDRIVVGECRGGEALDMLQAMNTGHDGSLTTIHANSPRDAISRLETMVMMAGMELPHKAIINQIASAVDVIVHLSRFSDGSRKVVSITEIEGLEGDTIVMREIFKFVRKGRDSEGRIIGEFVSTGFVPLLYEELKDMGEM